MIGHTGDMKAAITTVAEIDRVVKQLVETTLAENGAIVVIAHPVLLKKNDVLELINENVDGLEAIYPKNKAMDEKLFREICAKRGMIITAGSDYHGIIDYSHEDLAYNVLEGKDLTNFLNRLGVK
jgi:hypothetical protein